MIQSAKRLNARLLELHNQGRDVSLTNPEMVEIIQKLKTEGKK